MSWRGFVVHRDGMYIAARKPDMVDRQGIRWTHDIQRARIYANGNQAARMAYITRGEVAQKRPETAGRIIKEHEHELHTIRGAGGAVDRRGSDTAQIQQNQTNVEAAEGYEQAYDAEHQKAEIIREMMREERAKMEGVRR